VKGGTARISLLTIAILAFVGFGTMNASSALAHDVPGEIIIRGFAKPDGDRLDVAMRVPLILLSQLDLPKRGPGYLDLERIDPSLDRAGEKVASELLQFSEGDAPLTPSSIEHRISLPSDDKFATYDEAVHSIRSGELPANTNVFWNQGFFDVHFTFPIAAEEPDLHLDPITPPGVGDKMEVVVQYIPSEGSIRTFRLSGDTGPVAMDPSWLEAAGTFVESGVRHILGGIDHLLFLLCLVLPLRDMKRLLPVVTSFTVAHSIALVASAQGLVPTGGWFPPVVEAVIAASIVYMAVQNVIAPNLRHRWVITGIFGIVHGFGFSYGLQQEFQLAGDHLLTSLLSFNLGVEIGQVIVLAVALPVLALAFRVPTVARFGVAVASVVIGHTAWHWMVERLSVFPSLEWPALDEATIASIARILVILMLLGAGIHVLMRRMRRQIGARPGETVARTESTPEVMPGI
jgi:HupE / UreJ protein